MTLPRGKVIRSVKSKAGSKKELGSVVLSSRIRLARNVDGEHFPDWCSPSALKKNFVRIAKAAIAAGQDINTDLEAFPATGDADLNGCLFESHYISRDLLNRGEGAGYILTSPEQKVADKHSKFAMMINEEDHIRIQVFRDDYNLEKAWTEASTFDSALEKHVEYAFSKRLGYLTSCPSNIGTGMRASVMLTLPGLLVCDEFESTCRAVDRLGYNVRGINGENTTTASCIVQISNKGTLGFTEEEVIARLKRVVDEVIRVEYQARRYALTKSTVFMNDMMGRSLSLLQCARVLQSEEAVNALTAVRLGVELGLIKHLTLKEVDLLINSVGHYAIRKNILLNGGTPEMADDADYRDLYRSTIVREVVAHASQTLLPETNEK